MKCYFAVGEDGEEVKFDTKPARHYNGIINLWTTRGRGNKIRLTEGTIEKLLGRILTWSDEPVELKE